MLSQIQQLQQIATKPSRLVIGLMSGTSLDGLDIALCKIEGSAPNTRIQLEQFTTVDYSADIVADIRQIFSKNHADLQKLCLLNEKIGTLHGKMVREQLEEWHIPVEQVDLVASHGQTIFHAPISYHNLTDYPNGTLQIGDGDHVARETGIITLADFRQRHIAAGGEGAPLVVYGDCLLFSSSEENRIMLNIGGIANFTYIPQKGQSESAFCSDVGPGNTMMDAYIQQQFPGQNYDQDATLALQGEVSQALLKALSDNPFFEEGFPKTTGPELFNLAYLEQAQQRSNTLELSVVDVVATLNKFSADIICAGISRCINRQQNNGVYVSGGGALNPLLLKNIQDNLPDIPVASTDALDINPNAKEAILFALIANECVAGNIEQIPHVGGMPKTSMGKICFPL